jgi:hypothetical protein
MFLRPNRRAKDAKEHSYWSLVETVRTPDGSRQRTLCYLGELNSSAQARWLKTIEVFNEQGDAQPLATSKALALLSNLHSADIVLPTTDQREIHLRRITEPTAEQKSLLQQLGLSLPESFELNRKCSVDLAIA